jgi:hypothetical protein
LPEKEHWACSAAQSIHTAVLFGAHAASVVLPHFSLDVQLAAAQQARSPGQSVSALHGVHVAWVLAASYSFAYVWQYEITGLGVSRRTQESPFLGWKDAPAPSDVSVQFAMPLPAMYL